MEKIAVLGGIALIVIVTAYNMGLVRSSIGAFTECTDAVTRSVSGVAIDPAERHRQRHAMKAAQKVCDQSKTRAVLNANAALP